MSIIREKIRFNASLVGTTGTTGTTLTGNSMNLIISLGSCENFIEYGEDIDNLTQFTVLDLVNPVIDGEVRRFKLVPAPTNDVLLQFFFYNVTASTYQATFTAAGFTADEIFNNNNNLLNSFFILDFYDTADLNSQTKIFTTYLTKILQPYHISLSTYTPEYLIGTLISNQLYRWYVPLSYINAQTGSTVIGYVKFSFYNAKTGNITPFYNQDNESLTTPERIFFKAQLDLTNMTWKMLTTVYSYIKAKEIANNNLYINKVNNTVGNMDNLQQNPPSGNTYNYKTNTYLIT
jgi:hypothetical protein